MKKLLQLFLLFVPVCLFAQVDYNANQVVTPYEGFFRPGSNLGVYQNWNEVQLSTIAAGDPSQNIKGAGVKAIRPALRGDYLDFYGYDAQAATFNHYKSLGLEDLTCIVGYPPEWARDTVEHCPGFRSEMFIDLYSPIWDDGANGTPYNDYNHFAAYMYRVVDQYKDHVKFWEIWNEPGFDFTGAKGWLPPGPNFPGNWWDNDPDPCDNILRAPVYQYVRMLRISYQIIKSLDPDAYVSVAGVGFPSFLDAVMRHTDNPVDGSVTDEYPLTGGAYFDVMGFHSYPHFDGSLRYWSSEINGFIHTRHSDSAADGILRRQNEYQSVLANYGYDGETYPEKNWIITEINVPRRSFPFVFGHYIGSEEAQINFLIKAVVTAMQNGIHQMHVYNLGEEESLGDADYEFDLMGLYKKIAGKNMNEAEINQEGIAYKTASDLLFRTRPNDALTDQMLLPEGVRGGAFVDEDGETTYVLWAKTSIDSSEVASAEYSFPYDMDLQDMVVKKWDFSNTGETEIINSQFLELDATPIFLSKAPEATNRLPTAGFTSESQKGCIPFEVNFLDVSSKNTMEWNWTFDGGDVSSSALQNPTITYDTPGEYLVSLTVSNANGEDAVTRNTFITVGTEPVPEFSYEIVDDSTVVFTNESIDGESYLWGFGDGSLSIEENPSYTYKEDGEYGIVLQTTNFCGTVTTFKTINIVTVPEANFASNIITGCIPLEVQFENQSSDNATTYEWIFSGGDIVQSDEASPTITYSTPGYYNVMLVASNEAGRDTINQPAYIIAETTAMASFETTVFGRMLSISSEVLGADSLVWDLGDGTISNEMFPNHTYQSDGEFTIIMKAFNYCGVVELMETVNIITPPIAGFAANIQSGCTPLEVTFEDLSTDNVEAWFWLFPGATPDSAVVQNPTVVYEMPGSYSVVLQVTNAAGENTTLESSFIVADASPVANFEFEIEDSTVTLMNTSSSAIDYSWDFGDGTTSEEMDPSHQYNDLGDFEVQLIATNADCGTDTITQVVSITMPTTSVDLTEYLENFQLFPNPNTGQFTLLMDGESRAEMNFRMMNILGQVIHQETLDFRSGYLRKTFAMDGLSSGTYLIELRSEDEVMYRKIIVEQRN